MTDNLFQNEPETTLSETKDYLADLVGEGKKFASPQELAKGKAESDLFINRLQAEQKALRDELASRIKMEEFLDKLSSSKSPESNEDNQSREQGEKEYKVEDIEKLLDQRLTERERVQQQTRNLELVKQELKKNFGDNYTNKLKDIVTKTGVGEKFLNELAATQPKAFLHFIGMDSGGKVDGLFVPPQGETFKPSVNSGKTFKHFEDLRKSDPTKYWTPSVQNEIYKLASEQGEAFYN